MKTLIIFIAILLCTSALAGPIEKVIVFADRAEVTRLGTGHCQRGKATVRFESLPNQLDVRTLRARASQGATALGASSRDVTLDSIPNEKVAGLRAQLEDLDRLIDERTAEHEMATERFKTVAAYREYFAGVVSEDVRNARPDLKAWTKALRLFGDESETRLNHAHTLTIKLRELTRRHKAITVRLSHFGAGVSRQVKQVDVSVKCGRDSRPRVRLSYVLPGATWRPEYDVRFRVRGKKKVGKGKASLTVAAVIRQATGEDWDNVQIILSTAKPQLGSRAPQPGTIMVKGQKDGEEKTLVQATERRDALLGPAGSVSGGPKGAEFDDGGQSFTLKLPREMTVKNDGRPYWVPVDRRPVKATSKLVATPALSPYVHQVAQLSNPAPYPLMAGTIHIHRAGTFIGKTALSHTAPGEPIELTLGIDQEVRLARRSLKKMNRAPGFLSSTKHIEHGYRISMDNRSDSPVTVEIRERVPVSKIRDVKVKIEKSTSPGFTLDGHRGFLTWSLPLKPGENRARDLFFTIHLPDDWKVGL